MPEQLNPYQSPTTDTSGNALPNAGSSQFVSGSTRARVVVALLGLGLFLDAISLASSYMQLQLLHSAQAGEEIDEDEASINDLRETAIGIAQMLLYFGTVVAVLMWFHRVHKNLPALRATGLRFTPGWAVGWWFIPFLNLVRPYQVTSEIWRASDPRLATDPDGKRWKSARASPLLGLWWAGWILINVLGRLSLQLSLKAESLTELADSTRFGMVESIAGAWPAICLMLIVRGIDSRQTAAFGAVCETANLPPVPPLAPPPLLDSPQWPGP